MDFINFIDFIECFYRKFLLTDFILQPWLNNVLLYIIRFCCKIGTRSCLLLKGAIERSYLYPMQNVFIRHILEVIEWSSVAPNGDGNAWCLVMDAILLLIITQIVPLGTFIDSSVEVS